nr:FIST N-terminal domain-containing protein [Bradyrhizobium diazoefficiens]
MLSLFSQASHKQPAPSIVAEVREEAPAVREACAIRVLESDDRLQNISEGDFVVEGARSPLVLAFISPHCDFARVASSLQRLAGSTPVIAMSTAGELCSAGQSLYKPTGSNWSSVVVQVLPADLFQSVSIHSVRLHNDDIRKGEPSRAHDARIEAITREVAAIRTPFAIDVRDTIAFALVDGVSASESYFMEAVYRSGKFPCGFVGGSAGGSSTSSIPISTTAGRCSRTMR